MKTKIVGCRRAIILYFCGRVVLLERIGSNSWLRKMRMQERGTWHSAPNVNAKYVRSLVKAVKMM